MGAVEQQLALLDAQQDRLALGIKQTPAETMEAAKMNLSQECKDILLAQKAQLLEHRQHLFEEQSALRRMLGPGGQSLPLPRAS